MRTNFLYLIQSIMSAEGETPPGSSKMNSEENEAGGSKKSEEDASR